VSIQALFLSLTTVVRPTSLAVILAMLAARRPRQLLAAYIAAGLVFSVGVGLLVVFVLGGVAESDTRSARRAVIDMVIGACCLGYAVLAGSGVLRRREPADPGRGATWVHRRLHDLSPSAAGMAGVLTHLPGLIYLAALNAIAGSQSGPLGHAVQVLVYNLIWYTLAVVALVLSVYRPEVAQGLLERLVDVVRQRERTILVGFFGALGAYLVVSGILDLRAAPG
jgi:hypothetical protein